MKRGQDKPGSPGVRERRFVQPERRWTERRAALLAELDERPRWRWNSGRRARRRYPRHRDILRLMAEGLVAVTAREGTAKFLVLTSAGRALLPTTVPPTPGPWAKRRAAVAEFNAAQDRGRKR